MDTDRPQAAALRHYTIHLPGLGLPLSSNDRRRATWQQVYRQGKVFRDAVAWQARTLCAGAPPLEHAHVVVTLYYRRRPFRDPDGAVASCKECVDGLVVGGLLADDSADHMHLEVRQEVGLNRRVEVAIAEVPAQAFGKAREESSSCSKS